MAASVEKESRLDQPWNPDLESTEVTALAPTQVPIGKTPQHVRDWFDHAATAALPIYDGTLATARIAANAFARSAKAANTRRAYRAGVRAWCSWCDQHSVPCLPARGPDVAAFLADQRLSGRSPATLDVRRAAIRYLHSIAGIHVPTTDACVAEAVAGIRRTAIQTGIIPAKKLAATASVLHQLLAPITADLRGLRDRALLLVGFAGALRRAELASIEVKHLEFGPRGILLTLPVSKGERSARPVTIPLPFGDTELCPVRALARWREAANITEGPVFRRIWLPAQSRGGEGQLQPHIGTAAIEPRTVARIIQARAAAAGFARTALGGHSLKRGALTTGMDRGVHPTQLKRLARHKTYAVLGDYLEIGDPFNAHPLSGVL